MRNRGSSGLLTITAVAAAMLCSVAPSTADPGSSPTRSTTVITGVTDSGAMFTGYFTATNFGMDPGGQLIVNGMLNGRLSAPGRLQAGVSQPITLPVDRQQSATNCLVFNLAIGPGDTGAGGDTLHLKQTEWTLMAGQGPGSRLVMPSCEIARRLRGPTVDPAVVVPLNEIVRLVAADGTQ